MICIKVWARTFTQKSTGAKFVKADVKGCYVPKGDVNHRTPIEEDEYYTVQSRELALPLDKDGQYAIYADEAWIDTRDGFQHVIHVRGNVKTEFLKASTLK